MLLKNLNLDFLSTTLFLSFPVIQTSKTETGNQNFKIPKANKFKQLHTVKNYKVTDKILTF